MAFSFLPREDVYFDMFIEMTGKIEDASKVLIEMMNSDSSDLGSYTKRIKDIEHACDQLMHKITTKLNKSFITPFDREDIYHLAGALDDICDYIDAGARSIVMYDITESNEYAIRLARVIEALAKEIRGAVSMLAKPNGMNAHFVEIHRLENEADEIYFRAIADLFKNAKNPIDIIKWKELYEILENATDRCESVATIIESIVLKHG